MTRDQVVGLAIVSAGFVDAFVEQEIKGALQGLGLPLIVAVTVARIPRDRPSREAAARLEVERFEAIVEELPQEYWPEWMQKLAMVCVALNLYRMTRSHRPA